MEPRNMYKQEMANQEETSYEPFSYEQGKISVTKQKGIMPLNVFLQFLLLLLSVMYYLSSTARYSFAILINLVFINTFFLFILWFVGSKIKGKRRILYSTITFFSSLGLLFVSLIMILGNMFSMILIAWIIMLLLNAVIYFLAKYTHPITI